MPDAPLTTPRTLRCANAALYAGFTLIVWAAAGYVVFFREASHAMQIGAAAASVVSLLWGGYYVLLRYEVDAQGISELLIGRRKRILWADLTSARLSETRTQETASAVLHLESATASMDLSSDLLPLEDVQILANELGAVRFPHACGVQCIDK